MYDAYLWLNGRWEHIGRMVDRTAVAAAIAKFYGAWYTTMIPGMGWKLYNSSGAQVT